MDRPPAYGTGEYGDDEGYVVPQQYPPASQKHAQASEQYASAPQQYAPPVPTPQQYPPPAQQCPPPSQQYAPPPQQYAPPLQQYAPPQMASQQSSNVVVVNQAPAQTVVVQRQGVNHALHLMITCFFWPWAIVWIILAIIECAKKE